MKIYRIDADFIGMNPKFYKSLDNAYDALVYDYGKCLYLSQGTRKEIWFLYDIQSLKEVAMITKIKKGKSK